MRSFLITGGAGFIGSHLVRKLVSAGHRVLNLDKLTYAGNLDAIQDLENFPNYKFVRHDIADESAVGEVIEHFAPDCLIHLAAETHVDRSIDNYVEFLKTNVLGTAALLQAALLYWRGLSGERKTAFKFIHVSTDEVFGSLGNTGYFTESSRYNPHSPYAASKASSDHLARAWSDTFGLPVIISNCSNNYGPNQYPEKLIPVVIFKALRGEPITVYGNGENVRDWIHVRDHCDALIIISEKGKPGESYNIGSNSELRNIDLVRILCKHLDAMSPRANGTSYSKQITFVKDRPGHDLRYAIDASKIQTELGWTPRCDLDEGLRETVAWFLENEFRYRTIFDGI